MATAATTTGSLLDAKLKDSKAGKIGVIVFGIAMIFGTFYAVSHLLKDLEGVHDGRVWPYVLLGIALLIALAFEFVNGFHDTANAVATVIYTHSVEPHLAVSWSGMWNFIGVLTSSGAVAFGIVSLLPVELILQVGSGAGYAMVFALLVSAILWNLGTWSLGLPASSSHTLIGSIMGVGIANQLLAGKSGISGVDWTQATKIGESLLLSPLVGFCGAALLLLLAKRVITNPKLYKAPEGNKPPPFWIRALLILTCTGVSFAHGSNDGQKGMGLIMLILIGTVPTAYALNHAVAYGQVQDFVAVSEHTAQVISAKVDPNAVMGDAHQDLLEFVKTKKYQPGVLLALRQTIVEVEHQVSGYKSLGDLPPAMTTNVRNEMYVISETLNIMKKSKTPALDADTNAALANYKKYTDKATKFIPTWVKVAVALALGLGTMVGWKRIVVTVGEKIGKEHLSYGQGAAAELVAMTTILAADGFGLPVSTTHVLSSGVAGTMAANGSGLQMSTIRNMAMAWVLTLPVAMLLSGCLFWLFKHLI